MRRGDSSDFGSFLRNCKRPAPTGRLCPILQRFGGCSFPPRSTSGKSRSSGLLACQESALPGPRPGGYYGMLFFHSQVFRYGPADQVFLGVVGKRSFQFQRHFGESVLSVSGHQFYQSMFCEYDFVSVGEEFLAGQRVFVVKSPYGVIGDFAYLVPKNSNLRHFFGCAQFHEVQEPEVAVPAPFLFPQGTVDAVPVAG